MKANLYISLSGKKIHSFHFFGGLGFVIGLTLGLVMGEITGLSPWIILLMSGVGAVTFFIMVYVAKGLTGKEVIVYYHHEISIGLSKFIFFIRHIQQVLKTNEKWFQSNYRI